MKTFKDFICEVSSEDIRLKNKIAEVGQEHHLDKLVDDPSTNVRCSVAKRGFKKHLDKLVNDPDYLVRDCVARFSNYPEHLNTLMKDPDPDVRLSVAKRGNREHLDTLIKDKSAEVREAVARHGDQDHIDKLISDRAVKVRAAAMYRTRRRSHVVNVIKNWRAAGSKKIRGTKTPPEVFAASMRMSGSITRPLDLE